MWSKNQIRKKKFGFQIFQGSLLREALFTSATSNQNAENLSVSFRVPDYNHFLPVASEGGDSAVVYR